MPSAKLSVAVPNMWTCTSPGWRKIGYLKWWCSRLAKLWLMLASPDRKGLRQITSLPRRMRLSPRMSAGGSPTRISGPKLAGRSLEWARNR
jgi:hypothetical protein